MSVAPDAGSARAADRISSVAVLFMVASSESEVHQEFDFLLVCGLRVVAADHREPVALAAEASGPLGDAVRGVAAHRPAGSASGFRDGGDVEIVVVARRVLLVADLLLELEVHEAYAVSAKLREEHLPRPFRAAHRPVPVALRSRRVHLAGGAVDDG